MERKSLFFKQKKHSSPNELIMYLNQCSVNPKFIQKKEKDDLMEQNRLFFNKIGKKKCISIVRNKSGVINRSQLQKEFLRFLITNDGPQSVFYQLEKKKFEIKLQDMEEFGQPDKPHICLSKMLGQYQELVNPF
ncbi:unnamed protein product [Paramecium sonneborni]|uniref:Uncharacterized protein n=1 Tax=Paramecium sonneborni TaxID=65129 RepID=A0A8S1LQP9_9CILI|nr:unnamed protein product [Paramecium sonneborni]